MVGLQLFPPLFPLQPFTSSPCLTLRERLKLWEVEQSQFESKRTGEKVSLAWKATPLPPLRHPAHSSALVLGSPVPTAPRLTHPSSEEASFLSSSFSSAPELVSKPA